MAALPLFTFSAYGQDPIFSQFYSAPLQINPAFTGIAEAPRLFVNYRNQWSGFSGGYNTYALSYEQWVEPVNSGFGIMLLADNAMRGVYNTYHVNGTYSYRLRISRKVGVRFGLQAGMIWRQLDWEKLLFGDQLDRNTGDLDGNGNPIPSGEVPPESLQRAVLDLGAGLLFYTNKLYAGFSAQHINHPNESFYQITDGRNAGLPLRYTAHAGYEFDLGGYNNNRAEAFISPNVMYIQQSDFAQINAGAHLGFNLFYGGLWYRHTLRNSDAVIVLAGVRYGIFRFGYSYDFTLSGLENRNSRGSHEISLTLNFAKSEKLQKRRKSMQINDCFRMFE